MDTILSLQQEHNFSVPEEFHFVHAQLALSAGLPGLAVESVNRYLNLTGRAGEFYAVALQLWDRAEEQREAARAAEAAVLANVVPVGAAVPLDLATAEQEAFAELSGAVASLAGAADHSASIRAAEQLTEAVDRARNAFAAADDARRAAADGYRDAYRAALAAAVTCANGYPCTSSRLDPFEGIAGALITHLHLLASVSFAAAVHVEATGAAGADEARARGARIQRLAARLRGVEAGEVLDRWNGLVGGLLDDTEATSVLHRTSTGAQAAARRSRFDAADRVLAAIAASRGRATDAALGALLDATRTRAEALRSTVVNGH